MRTAWSPRVVLALAFGCILAGVVAAADKSPARMATAATRFLAALTPEQRQEASFAFNADERRHWGFVPTEMFPRKGLTIKRMSDGQRTLARELLKAGLSDRGYLTTTSIMDLETVLNDIERQGGAGNMIRDPERYFFSIFGTPSTRDTWGWRVEGHHVSLNFTIVNGTMAASTPSFFGDNPAEVRDGPEEGLRILAAEEDTARALFLALEPTQRQQALITAVAPNDIITMNKLTIDPLAPAGIPASALNKNQRELLTRVIAAYSSAMAPDIAADRTARLQKAGLEKITFAWAGEAERGKKHYYRIQGPTFLIEYDNTQNDANHIHSVWRDFNGDFGADLLREHVKSVAH